MAYLKDLGVENPMAQAEDEKTYQQQYEMWLKVTKDPAKAARHAWEDVQTAKERNAD